MEKTIFLLLIFFPSLLFAQINVTGTVFDESGDPVIGANVIERGTTNGTATNEGGNFALNVKQGATLEISFVGYITKNVTISSTHMTIVLQEDVLNLQEVIATGYMTQRKADLTGAVSIVKAEDIAKTPNANVMKSLQGKIPGVLISTDGNPAENVSIQVRGITSMRSAPPLIVIDGQPVSINLRDINPNDIESIQVLRDAASASIYGSRAASGVILVNTKKGKSGRLNVLYDGYVGFSQLVNVPKMLDTDGYGRCLWQATVNDGDNPTTAIRTFTYDWDRDVNGNPVLNKVTPVEWLNPDKTMPSANTNWFKEGTRTGIQQNHQLTVTTGSEKSSSLFSLNFFDNQGTQLTSFFRRYAARFNNEYKLLGGRLTIGENMTITHLNIHDVNSTYAFLVMPPNIPVYANDGGWGGSAMGLGMDDYNNPVRELMVNKDNVAKFMKVLGSFYGDLKVLKNLTFRTQYGIDYSMWYDRLLDYTWEEAGGKRDDINGVSHTNWHSVNWTWTNTLLYNLAVNKNNFDILVGTEAYSNNYERFYGYRDGILLEDRDYAFLNSATGDTKILESNGDEYKLLSYFGKINYDYNSTYLLSTTIRYDGASKFGKNNRFGVFPAFSAGWRIKNTPFLENVDWLSDLKLRASWGMNGNSNIPTNALMNIYDANFNSTSYAIAGNQTGSIPSGYRRIHTGNPNIQWEATEQTNLGFDFGVLKYRLSGSVDWFYKKTDGMLYEPPYIGSFGEGGYQWINAADMTNTGLELLLTWAENRGSFKYSISGNASGYKNTINDLPENVKYTYGGNGLLDNILGRPLRSGYGLVADGLFTTQEEVDNSPEQPGKGIGRIKYKDLDGDGRITETYDRTWIAVWDPDFTYGLNFTAQYKSFDCMMYFYGVVGNDVHNTWKELSDFWNIGVHNDRNHPIRILEAWSPSNPNSTIPALSRRDANGEKRFSTYFVENGSFLKLKTLDFGYTFSENVSNKLSINRLRLYVSAQNLFVLKKSWGKDQFTAADPENPGTGYPQPLTTYLGVNITF